MTEKLENCLLRLISRRNCCGVFPKDTTEWHKQVLNKDHVHHNHGALNHSTTLLMNLKNLKNKR